MSEIKNIQECIFDKSNYIKPKRVSFERDNKKVFWDYILIHDCVSTLLYHEQKDVFLFVKQFRPAFFMYLANKIQKQNPKTIEIYEDFLKNHYQKGYTLELCSGIVDKNLSHEQIAIEECVEETGFKPKKLEFIGEFYNGLGTGVSNQKLYYANICDDDRVCNGGGVDDECIEIEFVKINEFHQKNTIKTPLSEYAYLWFMQNKYKK